MQLNNRNVSRRGKKGKRGGLKVGHSRTVVPRTLFSSELDVYIPFTGVVDQVATATVLAVARKLNTLAESNFAYVGLANYNNIYRRYRVISYDVSISFQNLSTTIAQDFSSLVTNSSTAAATAAIALSNGVNPGGKLSLVGISTGGSDVVVHRHKSKVVHFEGSVEVETDDSFAAATNAVADPTNLLYLQIANRANSGASVALTSTILFAGSLWVRYFDAIQQ